MELTHLQLVLLTADESTDNAAEGVAGVPRPENSRIVVEAGVHDVLDAPGVVAIVVIRRELSAYGATMRPGTVSGLCDDVLSCGEETCEELGVGGEQDGSGDHDETLVVVGSLEVAERVVGHRRATRW